MLTEGDATFGEGGSFTRGFVVVLTLILLLPLLEGSFLDELSTGAAVLTTGNAFLTAGTEEGADLLPNRDPKIDRLDFSLPDELLLLILAFDKEEIGRGSFPLAGEGVPAVFMFEFDSLGLDETTALDMEVDRFFFTSGMLVLPSSPLIKSSTPTPPADAKMSRPPLLTGVRSDKFLVSEPKPLPSPSAKFGFSLFERAAFDMDEDLARGLPLLLLSTTFGAEADEPEAGDVDGLDGFVLAFRLLFPLYSQSTGTSNSVFVIMTWLVSPLLALPFAENYVSAFYKTSIDEITKISALRCRVPFRLLICSRYQNLEFFFFLPFFFLLFPLPFPFPFPLLPCVSTPLPLFQREEGIRRWQNQTNKQREPRPSNSPPWDSASQDSNHRACCCCCCCCCHCSQYGAFAVGPVHCGSARDLLHTAAVPSSLSRNAQSPLLISTDLASTGGLYAYTSYMRSAPKFGVPYLRLNA